MAAVMLLSFPVAALADPGIVAIPIRNVADITVTGKVVDEKGVGLPGVSVQIKGTSVATQTDANGLYRLVIPDNQVSKSLSFSYLGFVTQDISIAGRTRIDVKLIANESDLSEVVVVGYGVQKKVSVTGAINTIDSKNIENKPVLNTFQALQGESPNLIIQQTNLNPGSDVVVVAVEIQKYLVRPYI